MVQKPWYVKNQRKPLYVNKTMFRRLSVLGILRPSKKNRVSPHPSRTRCSLSCPSHTHPFAGLLFAASRVRLIHIPLQLYSKRAGKPNKSIVSPGNPSSINTIHMLSQSGRFNDALRLSFKPGVLII
jgi:hypothetical protein